MNTALMYFCLVAVLWCGMQLANGCEPRDKEWTEKKGDVTIYYFCKTQNVKIGFDAECILFNKKRLRLGRRWTDRETCLRYTCDFENLMSETMSARVTTERERRCRLPKN